MIVTNIAIVGSVIVVIGALSCHSYSSSIVVTVVTIKIGMIVPVIVTAIIAVIVVATTATV